MQPTSTLGTFPFHFFSSTPLIILVLGAASSTGRSNSVSAWRGYLPIKPQVITQFSQKIFLGGIPPELTEG